MIDKRKYSNRSTYLINAVEKRRDSLKLMAIDILGGKCQICGYNKYSGALEFHHLDPLKKNFSLSSRGLTRSKKKIIKEIRKCVLLCSNCHKEVHALVTQLPHESVADKRGELQEA